jgi:hypothetical protein
MKRFATILFLISTLSLIAGPAEAQGKRQHIQCRSGGEVMFGITVRGFSTDAVPGWVRMRKEGAEKLIVRTNMQCVKVEIGQSQIADSGIFPFPRKNSIQCFSGSLSTWADEARGITAHAAPGYFTVLNGPISSDRPSKVTMNHLCVFVQ